MGRQVHRDEVGGGISPREYIQRTPDANPRTCRACERGSTMPPSSLAKAGMDYSGAQTNISVTQESMNYHWGVMPTGAKDFILNPNRLGENDGFIGVRELAAYWSAPGRRGHAVSDAASSLCGASLYLALIYIRMGRYGEARALVINGCFLHQCFIRSTPIGHIQGLCSELSDDREILAQLPQCLEGFCAVETPQKMERYAKKYLPPEYRQLMTSIGNLSDRRHINNYVGQSKFNSSIVLLGPRG